MQEHYGNATTGDISGINFIQGTSKCCRSSKEAQEGEKEPNETGPGQAGAGEEGTGSETETAVSTWVPAFRGAKGW